MTSANLITVATGAVALSTVALAQETPQESSGSLIEIIVTAQKRAENVQDVPIAVSALTGDVLAERQVNATEDLATVIPNVSFGSFGGAARIAIRGVGYDDINPTTEGRVAYHVNGVYLSRPGAALGSYFDVQRVEVLRGPQGALYGRNATGGSINVLTNLPEREFGGYLNATVGNYGQLSTTGALTGPVTEDLSARLAFQTNDRDGYGRNVVTGNDIDNTRARAARASLKYEGSEKFSVLLTGDYATEDDRNYAFHYNGRGNEAVTPTGFLLGGTVPANARDIANSFDPSNDREFWGVAADASWDLGSVALRSITSWRDGYYHMITPDLDLTSANLSYFFFDEEARQFSQELQLSGTTPSVQWIVGAYYFDEHIEGGSHIPFDMALLGAPTGFVQGYAGFGKVATEAAALFGQADISLGEHWLLSLGGRYSWERKSNNDFFQFDLATPYPASSPAMPYLANNPNALWREGSKDFSQFTPRAALQYSFNPDVMVYVSASRGFKSGGFNLGVAGPAFDSELLWDYEIGLKSTWLDGRLRTNLALFKYDYTNLQVSKVVFNTVVIENASSAKLHGAEFESAAALTDRLSIDFNLAWLDSKYVDYATSDPARLELGELDLSGNQLVRAPEWSGNFGAEYSMPVGNGALSLRGEVTYSDRVFFTPFNTANASQPGVTRGNAFLTYKAPEERWHVSGFVRNVSNETVVSNDVVGSGLVGFPVIATYAPPRMYGVEVGARF